MLGKFTTDEKKIFPHLPFAKKIHIVFLKKKTILCKKLLIFLECVCHRENFMESFIKISEKNFHCSPFDILLNWIIKSIPNSENDTDLQKETIPISYKYVKTCQMNILKM